MSGTSLRKVLEQIEKKLETYSEKKDARGKKIPGYHNDNLRRGFSGYNTHTVEFSTATLVKATISGLIDNDLPVIDASKIQPRASQLEKSLKALWGTSGTTHTVEYDRNKPINVFRKIFGEEYKKLIRAYNTDISRLAGADTSVSLIDAGHVSGYGIGDSALLGALVQTNNLDTALKFREETSVTKIKTFLGKIPDPLINTRNGQTFEFHIQVEMEGQKDNRGTAAKLNWFKEREQGFIKKLREDALTILKDVNWPDIEGSPTPTQEAANLIAEAFTGKVRRRSKKMTSVEKTKKVINKHRVHSTPGVGKVSAPPQRNWLSMMNLINLSLKEAVISNMGAPGLVNRTGTFAGSARITNVIATPQGMPSFTYTYDKSPYGVFDPRFGAFPWATKARDPNPLIEKSIRQVASQLAIGRFYLRRS